MSRFAGRHSKRDRAVAQVSLGDIDPKVTDRLRSAADVPDSTRVALRGSRWVVVEGPTPRIANLDGSGLHPARSPAERAMAQSVSSDAGTR